MIRGQRGVCFVAGSVVLLAGVRVFAATPAQRLRRTPVVEAFEKVRDSVVNISATEIVEVRRSPTGFHTLFDEIFDFPTRKYERTGVGSGFVIHRDGYIVTNAHVVAKTVQRKVSFADGREFEAEIVAMDTKHDLAVLSIKTDEPVQAIKLGRSDDLMIGETVIAVGNPLGLENTVTVGVISALDRTLNFSEKVSYRGLIQTDASINPGNSGGPLLNINGELIGINSAIRGDAQNIGFAIPVDQLRALLPEILDIERLKRARIGMRISGSDEARVTRLDDDGPAQRGGVRISDQVTAVDGVPTARAVDVYLELLSKHPGDRVRFTVRRNGRERVAAVLIAEVPEPDGVKLAREKLGLILEALPTDPARRLRLRSGVLVASVIRTGPADRAGIEPGDVLFSLGRYATSDLKMTGQLLEEIRAGDLVEISVLRAGRRHRLERFMGTIRAR